MGIQIKVMFCCWQFSCDDLFIFHAPERLVRNDATARSSGNGPDGKFMKTFFDDVELVKQNIVSIADTTREIGRIDQAV